MSLKLLSEKLSRLEARSDTLTICHNDSLRRIEKLEARFDSFSGNVKETNQQTIEVLNLEIERLNNCNDRLASDARFVIKRTEEECHNLREQLETLQEAFDRRFIDTNKNDQIQQLVECLIDLHDLPEGQFGNKRCDNWII